MESICMRELANSWYIGGITDWNAFSQQVSLSFMGEGQFDAEVLEDGINADSAVKRETSNVKRQTTTSNVWYFIPA